MFYNFAVNASAHHPTGLLNSRKTRILTYSALACYIVFIVIQLVLIFTFDGKQVSDAGVYLDLAKNAARNNTWYPSADQIGNKYFAAIGYINLLALILRFTDDLRFLYLLNFVFNNVILFSGCYIAKNVLKHKDAALLFTIVFCLFPTFWGEVVQLRTETMFTALAYLAVALSFSRVRLKPFWCGVLLAAANFVRPTAIVFVLAIFAVFYLYRERKRVYIYLLGAFLAVTVIFGIISDISCGYFVYQPTTSGINLLIGANDDADGSYDSVVFTEGHIGYISDEDKEKMTFQDYDAFYKKQAVNWILEHPIKYMLLIPKKIFYMYATELYSCGTFDNNETAAEGADYINALLAKIKNGSRLELLDVAAVYSQGIYMVVMLLFAAGIYVSLKKRCVWMIPMYLIFVLGTAMTVLVVGGGRYHYPYLPVIFISAVLAVNHFLPTEKEEITQI